MAVDTYPEVVMKIHFVLLALAMYLLPDGEHQVTSVTILLLDLVMIHWIRWIQGLSFRENLNVLPHTQCLNDLSYLLNSMKRRLHFG